MYRGSRRILELEEGLHSPLTYGLGGPCRAGNGLRLALGADPFCLEDGPFAARFGTPVGTPGAVQFPLWTPILWSLCFGWSRCHTLLLLGFELFV